MHYMGWICGRKSPAVAPHLSSRENPIDYIPHPRPVRHLWQVLELEESHFTNARGGFRPPIGVAPVMKNDPP